VGKSYSERLLEGMSTAEKKLLISRFVRATPSYSDAKKRWGNFSLLGKNASLRVAKKKQITVCFILRYHIDE
jgi:hypothetical protein